MTCPDEQRWDLLSLQLVDEAEQHRLQMHLRDCAACRRASSRAHAEHGALLQAYERFDHDHHELGRRIATAVASSAPAGTSGPGPRQQTGVRLGRRTARRAALVLLPAACVVLGVVLFRGTGQRSVFADALAHLQRAETIVCRVDLTLRGILRPAAEGGPAAAVDHTMLRREQLYMSRGEGIRRDAYEDGALVSTVYAPRAGRAVVLDHARRTYQVISEDEGTDIPEPLREAMSDFLAERPIPEMHLSGGRFSPEHLIAALRKLPAEARRELGEAVFDGRQAVGFELDAAAVGFEPPLVEASPDNRVELWLDPDSGVPVRLVLHFVSRVAALLDAPLDATFTVTAVYDEFDFDVPLPAEWFEPVIPEGFTPATEIVELAEHLNEEALVEALRLFGELAGRYPASLNATNAMYEVSALVGSLQAKRLVARQQGRDVADVPETGEVGRRLQGLAFFAALQMSGRQPAYFGAGITPGDGDAVLLRWILEDGGTRVIHGDLSAETQP